jgi:hypothetical protein
LIQYTLAQWHDQSGLFGQFDEVHGRHHAVTGSLPPHQCLGTGDQGGGQVDDRLVTHHELVVVDRTS